MSIIYRYISYNFIKAFFIVLLIMSTLAWITQAIGYVDLFIDKERALIDFFKLTILMYPWVISMLIPASLLIASVISIDKMTKDSENVILDTSGISLLQKVSPYVSITLLVTILHYSLSLYLAPWSMSHFRDNINEIRSDIISSSFKKNQFSTPNNDYTIYVSEKNDSGNFIGIMIKDNNSDEITVTYTSKEARLINIQEQIILEMSDGIIFSENKYDNSINRISFENYKMNLSNIFDFAENKYSKLSEKSLSELIEAVSNEINFYASPTQIMNETHSRIASPLYALTFIIISLFYMQRNSNFRTINFRYFLYVGLIAFLLKLSGTILSNEIKAYNLYFMHYIIPISVISVYLIYLILYNLKELRQINEIIK